ncbi:MAG: hypothetical protein HC901_02675 [Bdellovibrionaceae bacterium]|nr:hypothetical protein [Pseudobdellovibrionaceae bacterium]
MRIEGVNSDVSNLNNDFQSNVSRDKKRDMTGEDVTIEHIDPSINALNKRIAMTKDKIAELSEVFNNPELNGTDAKSIHTNILIDTQRTYLMKLNRKSNTSKLYAEISRRKLIGRIINTFNA